MSIEIVQYNTASKIVSPLSSLVAKSLYDKLSFEVKGSEFSFAYQQKMWDGKKHLFYKKTQTFPTGLLRMVAVFLQENGHNVNVIDKRIKPEENFDVSFYGTLRKYQAEDLATLEKTDRGVIQWIMGAGKTVEECALIAQKKVAPVLILVHTKDLLYQVAEFIKTFLHYDAGLVGDDTFKLKDITVAIIHSLFRKIKDSDEETVEYLQSVKICFFEECHHCPAEMFYKISKYLSNAYFRYGVSGTPFREDGKDLLIEAITGPVLVKRTFSDLIKYDYLVRPRIFFIPIKKGIFKVSEKLIEYKGGDISGLSKQQFHRFGWIYDKWISVNRYRNDLIARLALYYLTKRRPVMILVNRVKHGKNIQEFIVKYKPNCDIEMLTGKDSSATRKSVLDRLRNSQIDIVIATPLADEGINIPNINCLILAGASKSAIKALQRIGRALRPSEGKKDAIIIDFKDYIKYLKSHAFRRYEVYSKEPEFEIKGISEDAVERMMTKRM